MTMSRLAIATSLLVTLTTSVVSAQSFARPPGAARVAPAAASPDEADLLVAPAPVDRVAVRAKLAQRRAASLAAFARYVDTGVFPANVHKAGELNVWRDAQGHYCAAATIIRVSGNVVLVDKVAEQNNFIKLADVAQGPLMDWILTSGLTQAELALIQRPFVGTSKRPIDEDPEVQQLGAGPGVVDSAMRDAETVRLTGLYRGIQTTLARNANASLDAATARLVANPQLARQLLAGS